MIVLINCLGKIYNILKSLFCKYHIVQILIFLCFSIFVSAQEYWSPEHVFYGKGGKLTYTPDDQGNTIPDFSHVGYRYGDVPIPDIPVVVEVEPVDGDDGASIHAAINSLYSRTPDENGFRGAVLLKKGTYQVAGQITIARSGIILRGEGDTDDGTVIIAEGNSKRDFIRVGNNASRSVISSSRVSIIENYVPVGRKYVLVSNTSGYTAGETVVIYRPGTAQWISDLKMDQISPRSDGGTVRQWKPYSYSFYFERILTKVSGDTLFFRNPVVMAMETKYGGGAVYKYTFNRIQNVGIEDICLKSTYASDIDEDHAWTGISIGSAEHGWVRNVTSWYFGFGCVALKGDSKFFTVSNCHVREPKSIITGGRRYSFVIDGSLNLVTGCTSDEARHDYATGSRVTGPNVFTNCTATNTHSDIGPHHRWAMGTLYERIVSDGAINVQDRDNMGSGHGWAGANQVFWNCEGASSVCQNPWVSAKNYNFGFIGKKSSGYRPNRPDGEWVGHNVPGIYPVSLYEAQLNNRISDSIIFSVIPHLIQINDTSFKMQFTLPVDSAQILSDKFQLTGPDEIKGEEFYMHVLDDYSVNISSSTFKNLSNATIKITVDKLTSKGGKSLQGVKTASCVIEDKRPVITGSSKIVDNVDDFVEASTSAVGYIYFVKYGLNVTTKSELDSLVKANLGRKIEVNVADTTMQIFTKGLPGDYYQYYAVSTDGYVSLPSSTWVILDETGPVTGINTEKIEMPFLAYFRNDMLIIDPQKNEDYMLEIFSIDGRLIYKNRHLSGRQSIDLFGNTGVMIVRKSTGTKSQILKIVSQ